MRTYKQILTEAERKKWSPAAVRMAARRGTKAAKLGQKWTDNPYGHSDDQHELKMAWANAFEDEERNQ